MNGYLGALQDVPERWKPVSGMLQAQMFNTRSIICTLAVNALASDDLIELLLGERPGIRLL